MLLSAIVQMSAVLPPRGFGDNISSASLVWQWQTVLNIPCQQLRWDLLCVVLLSIADFVCRFGRDLCGTDDVDEGEQITLFRRFSFVKCWLGWFFAGNTFPITFPRLKNVVLSGKNTQNLPLRVTVPNLACKLDHRQPNSYDCLSNNWSKHSNFKWNCCYCNYTARLYSDCLRRATSITAY